jgi:hypothetical protein
MKKKTKIDDGYANVDFECDAETEKYLNKIVKLSKLTLDQVITFLLTLYIIENEKKPLTKKQKRKNDERRTR